MQLLTVDDLGQAREKIKERFGSHLLRCEKIPAADSLGRILGEGVDARNNIPHFRRSTVDGYAVKATDVQGASESIPALLTCVEEVAMGAAATGTLTPGTCAYVPTGGMLPEGADAMVMVEYSEVFSGDEIAIYTSVAVGDGVVQIGEDFGEGERGLHRGTRIRAQEIGVMAALGIQEVSVYATLKVAIISTGDELISAKAPLEPGKIRDVNTSALAALAQSMGMTVVSQVLVPDVWESIEEAIAEAMDKADLVLISGGSSKGKKDMTEAIIDTVASEGVFTHGLALKPGKPTILGWDAPTATLFLGLPGHPVAAMMVFRLLMEWLEGEMYGQQPVVPITAKIATNVAGAPGRTTSVLVALRREDGGYLAIPILGKSGLISILSRAYGYVLLDKNLEGVQAGDTVTVWPV